MRKNATKIAALALSLALTVTSVNIPTNASAASVKLNKDKATLYVKGAKTKKTVTLKVSGTSKKVTFTSNKKSVATVNSKGKVTAKKAGKATITAKVGKKSYKCKVTVKKTYKPVTSLTVSPKGTKDKPYEMTVGQTKKIKATVKPAKPTEKGVTYKSDKTSVATVNSKGTITAKKAGSATITVTTKGATKTKSNKKATIAVKVVNKADDTPTTTPSDAPSDTPSDAPSGSPSDTPSDAPSDTPSEAPKTLPEMTEAKVIANDTIEATFASDVPADTEITLTKDSTAVDGTATKEGAKATFVSKSKLAVGTYTITAKLGDAAVSKEVTVEAERVEEIKVTSTQALLKPDSGKKTAIVYYDVYSQYGTSMRNSVSVTWTASSGTVKANKSTGRLEITKSDTTEFTYGQKLYLVGVDAKSGKTAQAEVSIGLEQAIDSIEFVGFLNKKSDTPKTVKDLAQGLPANFQATTYVMLYTVKDQDGQIMDAANNNITNTSGAALTFTADNPMVLDGSKIKDDSVYTIDGVEYSSATMEPGMYADQGGEVNLMAISNKTGKQTKINFTVGEAARLKSFSISAPSKTVADGDEWVSIPFEATDVNGNSIKNYETIVRSTNSLSLQAGDSTELWIQENNDGTAALYWSDSSTYKGDWSTGTQLFPGYTQSQAFDGQDRRIFLSATVMNGEGSNFMLSVSDMRRPTTISKVKLNDDDADALVAGNTATVDVTSDKVTYLDQYGDQMSDRMAKDFFVKSAANQLSGNRQYGVRATVNNNNHLGITNTADPYTSGKNITFNAGTDVTDNVVTDSVKYTVVEKSNATSDWDDCGKALNVSYSVVPMNRLTGVSVKAIKKLRLKTDGTQYDNGSTLDVASGAAVGDLTIENGEDNMVAVVGNYGSKTLTVPKPYYTISDEIFITDGNNKITGVTSGAIKWKELYDVNSAKSTRIEATKPLAIAVYNDTAKTDLNGNAKTNVKVSDGQAVPAEICFVQYYGGKQASGTVTPWKLDVEKFENSSHVKTSFGVTDGLYSSENLAALVFDQYGDVMAMGSQGTLRNEGWEVEFAVSDIKENTDELAHKPNSFSVSKNNSAEAVIKGAEVKDTFKLTATVTGTNVTATIPVTVNADGAAKVSSIADNSYDENFRKSCLDYTR